ncbi:hypothetical protein [Tepidiphilus sp. J10]|uniref:hypothetical protein n=1 Tax=Tepidiphilus sp. J10 TaxID=2502185 RepID=UPI00115EF05E|nr:hypothetical protein [Tepidiphilus sp. J10]
MTRKKIRLRQLYWILGLTLLGIIVAPLLRLLWHPPPAVQTSAPEPHLPWRVTLDERGRPVVFGLTLEGSTVADVRRHLGDEGEWAILGREGNTPVLEAYYPDFTSGYIEGKLILRFEGDAALLEHEFSRRGKKAPTAAGARKTELKEAELAPFSRLTLSLVTFLPKARLDEAVIRERFGPTPYDWKEEESDTHHYLYPERGIHVLRDERGRTVIEYAAPERLRRLVPARH